MEHQAIISTALSFINAIRREIGEEPLAALPRGSRNGAAGQCPIEEALAALIILQERRIVFCYPWHAAAAAKIWRVPFADPLLMSVTMPDAIHVFADAFRRGLLPDLLE
jgi:hypothetical protein